MRKTVAILLLLMLVVASAGMPAASQSPDAVPSEARYMPGVVWVKLSPGTGAAAERVGEWESFAVEGRLSDTSWIRLSVPEGEEEGTAAALMLRPDVESAEPDYLIHIARTPNDPSYGSQWNMDKIRAPLAWDMSTGAPMTIIAVLDTGVDLNHPDLQGNLWQNFGEIPGNGIDDDGNGFVDDRWGWNVYSKNPNPQDDHGHGTHVAGIVGAVGNNWVGVAGMMWRCRIMPLKVLNASGNGSYSNVAQGAYYAAQNGARIINMSLAGSDYSQMLQDAITDLYMRYGVVFVAAAGNCANGGPSCGSVNPLMYPASMDHVISVASADSGDQRASSSGYNRFVDLAAPGQSIYSTGIGGGYRYMSGTSMATPHVAGLAAFIRSLRPEWNPSQVEAHLKASAIKIGEQAYDASGRNDYFGFGRIDAAAALWSLSPVRLTASTMEWVVRVESGQPMWATLMLTNHSDGPASWSVEITEGEEWLQVSPRDGLIEPNGSMRLSLVEIGGLPLGLYRGQFRIVSASPFWDGDAPVVDVYMLILRQNNRLIFPFVFL